MLSRQVLMKYHHIVTLFSMFILITNMNCVYYSPLMITTSSTEAADITEESNEPNLRKLSDFHHMLLIRLLRPDRIGIVAERYVRKHLVQAEVIHPTICSL